MAFAALQNGTIIAGYRIDGTLGEGGMGTVYRATQLSLERVVAFKVVSAALSDDLSFRERFRREGQLQAALDHPHIVTVYEAGEADSLLFLAMRLIEGTTLKELITSRQLGDRRSMRLLTQMGDALDAAHAKGLVHRDVKPQNILVGAGDHAYLTDFGLTKARGGTVMTEAGHFVGTIDYIAPEQARGELATAKSDVYSLTCVLCECLTGQPPFVRASEERVLFAHLADPPPQLSKLRSELPPAIDDVVARGMAKDPADRPSSARELMVEARRALGPLPSAASDADAGATRLASAPQAGATRIATAADLGGTRGRRRARFRPPEPRRPPPPGATAPADTAPRAAAPPAFRAPAARAPGRSRRSWWSWPRSPARSSEAARRAPPAARRSRTRPPPASSSCRSRPAGSASPRRRRSRGSRSAIRSCSCRPRSRAGRRRCRPAPRPRPDRRCFRPASPDSSPGASRRPRRCSSAPSRRSATRAPRRGAAPGRSCCTSFPPRPAS